MNREIFANIQPTKATVYIASREAPLAVPAPGIVNNGRVEIEWEIK